MTYKAPPFFHTLILDEVFRTGYLKDEHFGPLLVFLENNLEITELYLSGIDPTLSLFSFPPASHDFLFRK
jgi:hypothetical protein